MKLDYFYKVLFVYYDHRQYSAKIADELNQKKTSPKRCLS